MSVPKKPTKRVERPKKKCQGECGKSKAYAYFFKVDSPLFPDGMINICRDCVRKEVDVENTEAVIGFLRQIDKPFVLKVWNKALQGDNHPIGTYLGQINSLQQYQGKTFDNSDGIDGLGKVDLSSTLSPDEVVNVKGEIIVYSDELVNKWGTGYKKPEYLKMEKFYQDMRATHEIHTPVHVNKLMSLSRLTVKLDRLLQADDWQNYTKLAKTIDDMEKSAGFRPADRQGIDEATGIRSFSQIYEEVEKKGFRKPPKLVFDEDIIDGIVISLANYYHRIVGMQILSELPEEIKNELDDFYEFDDNPVDLDDEEYEDLDFSIEEDEESEEESQVESNTDEEIENG